MMFDDDDDDDRSWITGFYEGKVEVLDTLIPDLIAHMDIVKHTTLMTPELTGLINLIDRWITHFQTIRKYTER